MSENYSGTKCPSCQSTRFENISDTPSKSSVRIMFVRCSSCKTAVGVMEYSDIESLIKTLGRKLGVNLD